MMMQKKGMKKERKRKNEKLPTQYFLKKILQNYFVLKGIEKKELNKENKNTNHYLISVMIQTKLMLIP